MKKDNIFFRQNLAILAIVTLEGNYLRDGFPVKRKMNHIGQQGLRSYFSFGYTLLLSDELWNFKLGLQMYIR
jgi:hypothetical protein